MSADREKVQPYQLVRVPSHKRVYEDLSKVPTDRRFVLLNEGHRRDLERIVTEERTAQGNPEPYQTPEQRTRTLASEEVGGKYPIKELTSLLETERGKLLAFGVATAQINGDVLSLLSKRDLLLRTYTGPNLDNLLPHERTPENIERVTQKAEMLWGRMQNMQKEEWQRLPSVVRTLTSQLRAVRGYMKELGITAKNIEKFSEKVIDPTDEHKNVKYQKTIRVLPENIQHLRKISAELRQIMSDQAPKWQAIIEAEQAEKVASEAETVKTPA